MPNKYRKRGTNKKSIEFAIQMELDGERYYKEQAEKNKENNL